MSEREQERDFSEDDAILEQLEDPVDIEAFRNLMEHAHNMKKSATSFIREEPERTSRKAIRDLCLKDKKKVSKERVKSYFKKLWPQPQRQNDR